jgi:hypothetical protein
MAMTRRRRHGIVTSQFDRTSRARVRHPDIACCLTLLQHGGAIVNQVRPRCPDATTIW